MVELDSEIDEVFPANFRLEDFPILAEPLAVEFANTLYRLSDGSSIDFLVSPESVKTWFTHAPTAVGITVPADLREAGLTDLRRLRGIVRGLLDGVVSNSSVDDRAVSALNSFASRAPARLELTWRTDAATAALVHRGHGADVLLAGLASECISFFASSEVTLMRRCERPECFMLFVQQHRRRRFCNDSCSHRVRQARYYRATTRKARAS
jgi:predicted RNA-binding Zn ribbon-like protein